MSKLHLENVEGRHGIVDFGRPGEALMLFGILFGLAHEASHGGVDFFGERVILLLGELL